MPGAHEQLSEQFRKWEKRGRGWQVFSKPVSPEPPFLPFNGHYLPQTETFDDGRRPTFLSYLVQKIGRSLSSAPPEPSPVIDEDPEMEPEPLERDSQVELQTSLPAELDISRETFQQFLLNLAHCNEPVAFELLGTSNRVVSQFAAHSDDAALVRRQLQAHFPEAVCRPRKGALIEAWDGCEGEDWLAAEFALAREFMFPLETSKLDPFVGIIGALSELKEKEFGLFQVLWQNANNQWSESIMNSVLGSDGRTFFVNSPELAKAAETKISRPLFAVIVRILVRAGNYERVLQLSRDLAASLSVFNNSDGNELVPLHNHEYDYYDHVEDTLRRQSRRAGMILNADELAGFVHLPTSAVRSPVLQRQSGKSKAAAPIVRVQSGLFLGENEHIGEIVRVYLSPEQRVRHMHVIGASGTGKSNLLFNLICQDIENDEGVAVLDPHGDLVDKILGAIPPARIDDVVLVDPSDEQYSVGFNVLVAHSELEKTLLASDLVSVFQRLSTSWGDQMNSVLQNAILAFLESDGAGTVADLRRFLIEPQFRAQFLKSVQDSEVVYYWQKGFPHLSGSKSIGPILTRLDTLLAKKPIRHMVSQAENRLDFAKIMDSGKIFLAKLPEGLLGRENSHLIGSLLISKFQQTAMSRQAQQIAARRDFWIYVDEFANFITPSMAEILSGARKYRIGLTLAHHELHQLQRNSEVASAVMSHPFTRVVFRVGDDDAKRLAEGFSFFEARDLRNLETGKAVCRAERSDYDFNLTIPLRPDVDQGQALSRREEVTTASRGKYGKLRNEIEAALRAKLETELPVVEQSKSKPVAAVPKPSETETILSLAEVPKPEIVKIENPLVQKPVMQSETPIDSHEQSIPRDLGRGGAQHQAIQQRIKAAAEALGFRGTIEKQVLNGAGSIDLLLENSQRRIACEISISTSVDQEVGNIAKCARAGFGEIVMVSTAKDRLKKIEGAVAMSLGPDIAKRVGYFLPDAFIERLRSAPPPIPPPLSESAAIERRGYKVKRAVAGLSPSDQKAREEEAIRAMTEAMRKKQKR